jgi:hypothetical protein
MAKTRTPCQTVEECTHNKIHTDCSQK